MKDMIKTDGINVRHCPTAEMLADFLTKPLQGSLFRKFRQVLLGYEHVDVLSKGVTRASSTEERVGNEDISKSDVEEFRYSNTRVGLISEEEEYVVGSRWEVAGGRKRTGKKSTSTCNPVTKKIMNNVYKAHNFVNNPNNK